MVYQCSAERSSAVVVEEMVVIARSLENGETKNSNQNQDQVHSCLKRQVHHYLDQYPHLSLRSVSLRSGVSFTTLSRLTKMHETVSTFSPHIVLNLSAFLWKEYRLEVLVDIVPNVIGKYLLEHFGKFISLRH